MIFYTSNSLGKGMEAFFSYCELYSSWSDLEISYFKFQWWTVSTCDLFGRAWWTLVSIFSHFLTVTCPWIMSIPVCGLLNNINNNFYVQINVIHEPIPSQRQTEHLICPILYRGSTVRLYQTRNMKDVHTQPNLQINMINFHTSAKLQEKHTPLQFLKKLFNGYVISSGANIQ